MKKIRIIFVLLLIFMGTILVSPISINAGGIEKDFVGDLTCGGTSFQFHENLPNFTSALYNILKFGTPVIIVITGMLDMLKAVSAQKEDEIKKAQQKFLRRLLAGAIVFLVFFIVDAVINFIVDKTEAQNALDCVNCFLKGGDACAPGDKLGCCTYSNSDGTKDYYYLSKSECKGNKFSSKTDYDACKALQEKENPIYYCCHNAYNGTTRYTDKKCGTGELEVTAKSRIECLNYQKVCCSVFDGMYIWNTQKFCASTNGSIVENKLCKEYIPDYNGYACCKHNGFSWQSIRHCGDTYGQILLDIPKEQCSIEYQSKY